MVQKFLMGNEAIALGAIHAGVNLVAGYPGTPSTEVLETVAKENDGSVYVEWSVNEKAAMEVAAGAAYAGARTLVTMKQVGLNVASDPLMSLAYVGVKGGMVILSADDPGPISSQTEQDTRHFAQFAKLPVFDPSSPEEAYEMIQDAFLLSEEYGTPVLFRPTTRVCHGCASVSVRETYEKHAYEGFVKDTMRWVIFPRTSYLNHGKIEKRNPEIGERFSSYRYNTLTGSGRIGICTSGISYAYTCEAVKAYGSRMPEHKLLKIATAHPFPEKLALEFLEGLDRVLCIEELDPVLERELLMVAGKHHLKVEISGKLDGATTPAGEQSTELASKEIGEFFGILDGSDALDGSSASDNFGALDMEKPELPVRPPVLCAGCPHRASFYAVKRALRGKKAVFSGDIGCYTLGNAAPLDMCDTCLCMGADVTIAQGLHRMEPDGVHVAFIGDSTFFASGITGVVNAVYNQTDILLVVLDNSTTAMTGHQPHPGTGVRMMEFKDHGRPTQKLDAYTGQPVIDPATGKPVDVSNVVSIAKILEAVGVTAVQTVDPLDQKASIETVEKMSALPGVKAIIFKSPCAVIVKPKQVMQISEACINCKKCINELGCPAIVLEDGKPTIEKSLCNGCGLCASVCPVGAIQAEVRP